MRVKDRYVPIVSIDLFDELVEPISASQFCFWYFGIPPQRQDEEIAKSGYKTICATVLSEFLGLTIPAIQQWGDSAYFRKMPKQYERQLGLIKVFLTICPELMKDPKLSKLVEKPKQTRLSLGRRAA